MKFNLSLPIDPGANFPDTLQAVGGAGPSSRGHTFYCQLISNPGTKTIYLSFGSWPASGAPQKLTLNFIYYTRK